MKSGHKLWKQASTVEMLKDEFLAEYGL